LRRWQAITAIALVGCAASGAGRRGDSPDQRSEQAASLRLELFVRDLASSVDFYKRVLGFADVKRSPDYVSLSLGRVVLGLSPVANLEPEHHFRPEVAQSRRGLGVEIVLEVENVAAVEQHVRSVGYPLVRSLEKQPWGLTDFRIADPDGYFVRITSRR
jgi:catechol 2,3-dioxygenase-like lactoylglutathione lyase family enzyme